MGIKEALESTAVYGVATVMLFLVSFFLAWLIIYVLKKSDKQEERLADIIQNQLQNVSTLITDHDKKTTAAIAMITEAQKYVRIEHESMLETQKEQTKILGHIANKMGVVLV